MVLLIRCKMEKLLGSHRIDGFGFYPLFPTRRHQPTYSTNASFDFPQPRLSLYDVVTGVTVPLGQLWDWSK